MPQGLGCWFIAVPPWSWVRAPRPHPARAAAPAASSVAEDDVGATTRWPGTARSGDERSSAMSTGEFVMTGCLVLAYLVLMFTCGARTFQRGRPVLGVLGALLPVLWLVGAFLPTRRHAGPPAST